MNLSAWDRWADREMVKLYGVELRKVADASSRVDAWVEGEHPRAFVRRVAEKRGLRPVAVRS